MPVFKMTRPLNVILVNYSLSTKKPKIIGQLTRHPVSAVVAHEVDGRVDHVEGHVQARTIAGLDAVPGSFQKVLDARTGVANRFTEKKKTKTFYIGCSEVENSGRGVLELFGKFGIEGPLGMCINWCPLFNIFLQTFSRGRPLVRNYFFIFVMDLTTSSSSVKKSMKLYCLSFGFIVTYTTNLKK